MPGGVNGMAMARMARVRQPSIKTVYVTGYNIRAAKAGADGPILRKPFADERLVSAVRDALAA
jgi:DNA-binding LytR/AlgR family response regulator